MKNLIILMLAAILTGCFSNSKNIDERKAYWERAVVSNIPVGTSKESLEKWANKNNIKYYYDQSEKMYSSNVEKIKTNDLVCSHWSILVNVYLDESENIKNHEVVSAGACL